MLNIIVFQVCLLHSLPAMYDLYAVYVRGLCHFESISLIDVSDKKPLKMPSRYVRH